LCEKSKKSTLTREVEIGSGKFRGSYDVEFTVSLEYDSGDTGMGTNSQMSGYDVDDIRISYIAKYDEDSDKYVKVPANTSYYSALCDTLETELLNDSKAIIDDII